MSGASSVVPNRPSAPVHSIEPPRPSAHWTLIGVLPSGPNSALSTFCSNQPPTGYPTWWRWASVPAGITKLRHPTGTFATSGSAQAGGPNERILLSFVANDTERSQVTGPRFHGCPRTSISSPVFRIAPALNGWLPGNPSDGAIWRFRIASFVFLL